MTNHASKCAPLIAVVALIAASCGGDSSTSEPERDPYDVYLEIAPAGAPELERHEALVRAAFGCGDSWEAPLPAADVPFGGDMDAALLSAYGCQPPRM